jgi:hypothetical protein
MHQKHSNGGWEPLVANAAERMNGGFSKILRLLEGKAQPSLAPRGVLQL